MVYKIEYNAGKTFSGKLVELRIQEFLGLELPSRYNCYQVKHYCFFFLACSVYFSSTSFPDIDFYSLVFLAVQNLFRLMCACSCYRKFRLSPVCREFYLCNSMPAQVKSTAGKKKIKQPCYCCCFLFSTSERTFGLLILTRLKDKYFHVGLYGKKLLLCSLQSVYSFFLYTHIWLVFQHVHCLADFKVPVIRVSC